MKQHEPNCPRLKTFKIIWEVPCLCGFDKDEEFEELNKRLFGTLDDLAKSAEETLKPFTEPEDD